MSSSGSNWEARVASLTIRINSRELRIFGRVAGGYSSSMGVFRPLEPGLELPESELGGPGSEDGGRGGGDGGRGEEDGGGGEWDGG